MIPLSDENPTLRRPVMTWAILIALAVVWVVVQGAGLDEFRLAKSVCDLGLVPGELTHQARLGYALPIGRGIACIVDNEPINRLTPLTSMFLHGGWGHLLGNALFLWVFGNNIEDSMGPVRFVVFYVICGLAAAAAHVLVAPASPVTTVGASGAISGVLGAYLVLFPHSRVLTLIPIFIIIQVVEIPAVVLLGIWFLMQIVSGVGSLGLQDVGGVAFWAHAAGFVAGAGGVFLFRRPERERVEWWDNVR